MICCHRGVSIGSPVEPVSADVAPPLALPALCDDDSASVVLVSIAPLVLVVGAVVAGSALVSVVAPVPLASVASLAGTHATSASPPASPRNQTGIPSGT